MMSQMMVYTMSQFTHSYCHNSLPPGTHVHELAEGFLGGELVEWWPSLLDPHQLGNSVRLESAPQSGLDSVLAGETLLTSNTSHWRNHQEDE